MPIQNQLILLIIIFFTFLTACTSAPTPHTLMDLYANNGHREGIGSPFNGVALIKKDQDIILKKAYGFSDRENKVALKTDAKFLLGSITKQFTAMLVLQQVDQGNLSLDKNVSDYLPYFPKTKGQHLSIHRLLSHSSGLPHYNGLKKLKIGYDDFFKSKFTAKAYAELIGKMDLINTPGTEFSYSSMGYILLGAILEQVTGKSYGALLHEQITKPLGLKNTGFSNNTYIKQNIVQAYQFQEHNFPKSLLSSKGGAFHKAEPRDQSNTFSTGGIYSSVEDLARWVDALKNHRLLSHELSKKMFTPNLSGYCYGLQKSHERLIRNNPNAPLYSHSGSLPGFNNFLAVYDDGTTIIILSNTAPVNMNKLVKNLHLAANRININDFQRDIIRPKIGDDLETFIEQGGMPAFYDYYHKISKRAGYKVIPTQLAYLELIELYLDADKLAEAEKIISELFMLYSRPEFRHLNEIAYLFLNKEHYPQAIEYFNINLKNYSYSAHAHNSLAEGYLKSGQYDLAVDHYQQALTIAKDNPNYDIDYFMKNLKNVQRIPN